MVFFILIDMNGKKNQSRFRKASSLEMTNSGMQLKYFNIFLCVGEKFLFIGHQFELNAPIWFKLQITD
ncbi:CLUMA_CG000409, isoform A [Clunio marinus]|uniref:CLUMA_CG000409, isoform A n=1 Tax=Clunio marinus TaxID=568069 RepID=A0A1J1HGH8_9DIPT|nr:CLUMA_CG000409, isoform A [Clunio marinus]